MFNEAQILQFIQAHLRSGRMATDLSVLLDDCQQALKASNYGHAMVCLELHRDARANIISYQVAEGQVWIRDARHVDAGVQSVDPWENYAVMGLNYLATLDLLITRLIQNENLAKGAKTRVQQHALLFMHEFLNPMVQLDAVNWQAQLLVKVVTLTAEIFLLSAKLAKKYIEFSKDFTNMQFDPVTQITITQRAPFDLVIEIEQPLSITSAEFRAEYQIQDHKQQAWYRDLEIWQQPLATFAAERILAGATIPTQLRYIPGPRNLFERQVWTLDSKAPHQNYEAVMRCYHSGTPGHRIQNKAESARATALSIQALYKMIGANHLYVTTVLSPTRLHPVAEEIDVHREIAKAVFDTNNLNIHHTNLPVNFFRQVVSNEIESIKILCEALGGARARSSESIWFLCIKAALQHTIEYANNSDKENPNLRILGLFFYMLFLLKDPHDTACLVACMSGKDRTAIVLLYATALALSLKELRQELHEDLDPNMAPQIDIEKVTAKVLCRTTDINFTRSVQMNFLQLARGGHFTTLAGGTNATRGCARLKDDSAYAVPQSLAKEVAPLLFGNSAQYNHKGPTVSWQKWIFSSNDPYQICEQAANNDDDDNDVQPVGLCLQNGSAFGIFSRVGSFLFRAPTLPPPSRRASPGEDDDHSEPDEEDITEFYDLDEKNTLKI